MCVSSTDVDKAARAPMSRRWIEQQIADAGDLAAEHDHRRVHKIEQAGDDDAERVADLVDEVRATGSPARAPLTMSATVGSSSSRRHASRATGEQRLGADQRREAATRSAHAAGPVGSIASGRFRRPSRRSRDKLAPNDVARADTGRDLDEREVLAAGAGAPEPFRERAQVGVVVDETGTSNASASVCLHVEVRPRRQDQRRQLARPVGDAPGSAPRRRCRRRACARRARLVRHSSMSARAGASAAFGIALHGVRACRGTRARCRADP